MGKLLLTFLTLLQFSAFAIHDAEKPTYTAKKYEKTWSTGLKRDHAKFQAWKKEKVKKGQYLAYKATLVPGKWDLTPKVCECYDQDGCGSCWAFGVLKAFESEWMLGGKPIGTPAFNWLVNNCGKGSKNYGCNGGDFNAGDNLLDGGGPWAEKDDPYTASDGRCKTGLSQIGTAKSWNLVGDGRKAPTFEELAIANHNSGRGHYLTIDVAVAGSWGSYSGGIYNGNGSGINHMIGLVGYDMETSVDAQGNALFKNGEPANGDGYLIVQNNWGKSWGENEGQMRTRAHRNQIAEDAMFFEVDSGPPPVPVDGGWTSWSDCVNGNQTRTCTNPVPKDGGKDCVGASSQVCTPGSNIPWGWIIAGLLAIGLVVVLLVRKDPPKIRLRKH